MPRRSRTDLKVSRLMALLQGHGTMLIIIQDYPDPDALAAAAALKEVANRAAVQCSVSHGGVVGRAENRALVDYLNLNLRPLDDLDPTRFDLIAMVDTQPAAGNNSLAPGITPQLVIDHHPIRRATRRAEYTEIRSHYGATCTILYEYLEQLQIVPDPPLATSLLYGIRSDTQDLGRESTPADTAAYLSLYPLSNPRMLTEIQRHRVPRAYFRMLARGLANARVHGTCVISGLGDVNNPDMMGEVADLLLRCQGCEWALCYGFYAEKLLLSLRTWDADANAGRLMHRLVGRKGTGGGHDMLAGGQVLLTNLSEGERRLLERTIQRRFLRLTGVKAAAAERLVD